MRRALASPLAASLLAALAATTAVWGMWLSPRWTISPEVQEVGVNPYCRVAGPELRCVAGYTERYSVDPGAACWQEIPFEYLARREQARGAGLPAWNPYVGSGFPAAFDGVHSRWSPARALLRRLPGDGGRDLLIFLRLLGWTWGIACTVALLTGWGSGLPPVAGEAEEKNQADEKNQVDRDAGSRTEASPVPSSKASSTGATRGAPARPAWTAGAEALPRRAPWLLLALAALAAALAPYPTAYIDIIFLDVDLLAPWFAALLAAFALGRVRLAPAAALAVGLGLLVGLLGFLQSQFVFAAAVAVLALVAAPETRGRSLALAAAAGAGLGITVPTFLPLIGHLSWFASVRDLSCVAADGLGWRRVLATLVAPPAGQPAFVVMASAAGLLLMAATARHVRLRFPLAAFLLLAAWVVLGSPGWVCSLPGISGVRFWRHLLAYVQALFVIGTAVAAWTAAGAGRRARVLYAVLATAAAAGAALGAPGAWRLRLLVLALASAAVAALGLAAGWRPMPAAGWSGRATRLAPGALALGLALSAYPAFFLCNRYLPGLTWWGPGRQVPSLPERIDPRTPIGQLAERSRREDRRHYGVGHVLFPGWPAVFGILDLRVVAPWYPQGVHTLNRVLFPHWLSDRPGFPDRFVRPMPEELMTTVEFQRVLAVHRVSLLSFRSDFVFFPPAPSPWARERCRRLAIRQGLESWLCPEVGSVGWFPRRVERAPSVAAAAARLSAASPRELLALAVIGPEGADGLLVPAVGRVLAADRRADRLAYRLRVAKPGIFAVADAFFPGWTARVGGREVPVLRANAAFKAVRVPAGEVELELRFRPGRWPAPPPR